MQPPGGSLLPRPEADRHAIRSQKSAAASSPASSRGHTRLEPFERIFGYKERPLHRAVMPPKPDGTPCWIKNPALVWEADHQFRMTFSRHPISSILSDIRHPLTDNASSGCT